MDKVRHVRMLTFCVMAAFAVGALGVSSSSAALPEWGKCVKLPATIKGKEHKAGTGKFANSNCSGGTTGGQFEFVKGTSEFAGGTEFTNTMTSPHAVLETSFGEQVKCSAETATGSLSGTKEVSHLIVTFKGCEAHEGLLSCENQVELVNTKTVGYIIGEIKTRRLKGKLVYISGAGTASPVVGLDLTPEETNGWFAIFGCGETAAGANPVPFIFSEVGRKPQGANGGDSIVSPITPTNTMAMETTQVYSIKKVENPETHELVNEPGVQEPNSINGKPAFLESQLFFIGQPESSGWSRAAQEETAVTKLNSGEELEIKA